MGQFIQQLITDALNVAYDIIFLDQSAKHQKYHIFHMPEHQGKPVTWAQFKAIAMADDPDSRIIDLWPRP
jgi:hypothetical protein